jgi:toxin ParE1/3/4
MPHLGERCQFRSPQTKGMRMWLVDGFSNYLIFYRVQGNMLQILRVIHGARNYATMFDGR